MHELSIAQSIIAIAENAAPKHEQAKIIGVALQIGELSGIEISSLEFAFSIIKKDTLLSAAEINIEIVKGEAECNDCKTMFHLASYGTCCPACGSYSMKVLKGKELRVLNILVED